VVGRHIVASGESAIVVGVVENAHDRGLDSETRGRLYKPLQLDGYVRRVSYVARVAPGLDIPDLAAQEAARSANAGALVETVESLGGRLAEGIRDRSFATLVLGLFALAGVAVTGAGIVATVAFVVARRTREVAIRMALGARASQVRGLMIRDAVLAALAGSAVGLITGRGLTGALEGYLFGIRAEDPSTLLLAAVALLAVTGGAAWWPSARAVRLDPHAALRTD
jgi:predicted lysophospholipase L1 biosynthesis ABC-type transport system permease subunit